MTSNAVPAPTSAALPVAAGPPGPGISRGSQRSHRVVLALVAAVAVLGSVTGFVVTRSPHHPAPSRIVKAQLEASYAFPDQRYGSGLTVTRQWTLSGNRGSRLTETVTVGNPGAKAVTTWFKDSIPEAVTSSVQGIRFHPDSVKVLRGGPVVEWHLLLPARGMVTVGYVAAVAPGRVTTARLAGWAKGLDAIEMKLNTPAKKHPRPKATPTYTYVPPAPTPTSTGKGGFGAASPSPFPTFACDPSVVTCTPSPASSSPGNGGF